MKLTMASVMLVPFRALMNWIRAQPVPERT